MSGELTTDFFGEAVRAARIALGLTQGDVAERLGISTQFYGRIERGHAVPSMETLVRMMQVLGISANALVGRPGRLGRPGHSGHSGGSGGSGGSGHSSGEEPPPRERPEVRRVVRKLRKASPDTIRVVNMVMDGLENAGNEEE